MMSITGPGSITAANLLAQTNMFNQLNTLSEQLGTGQAAQTYSGLGSQAGLALALNAQLSDITGYSNAATTVGTTLSIAQSTLTQLGSAGSSVQQAVSQQGAFSLDNTGQTATQESAASYLDQILSLLNTQVGNNYIFSGSAVDQPSVASTNDILNGNGAQAGLTQVIAERQQADLGADGLGRLTVGATGSDVTIGQDGSPFGFQLASVNSSLTGATVTGPSGSPPSVSVDLGVQSKRRGFDRVQPHSSRRLEPNHHAAGDHGFAAGRQPVHHRRDAGRHRGQSAGGADQRRRQPCADRVAGRLRHRRRQ